MRIRAVVVAVLALASICGCRPSPAPPPPPPPEPPAPPVDEVPVEMSAPEEAPTASPRPPTASRPSAGVDAPGYAVVRTFFGTDRDRYRGTEQDRIFGDGRGTISYGSCDVSIPRDHRMGELEGPSIWRLEFREDPERHVVVLSTAVLPRANFFTALSERIGRSSKKSAFLFVHGYNVSFEDAARRTAQISYDLGFDGAPVFYSWPSQGAAALYTVDEQSIEWAEANLRSFLDDFFVSSGAENVYLIAHSMGNRALTRAIGALLAAKPELGARLTEIILAAPDIDAGVFRRDIAPVLAASGRPVTLYASSEDRALVASKQVHGYPRAGDSGAGLVIVPGIETIDATGIDTSLLGHSYFAENSSVLADINRLVREGRRADFRSGLVRVANPMGLHWKMVRLQP